MTKLQAAVGASVCLEQDGVEKLMWRGLTDLSANMDGRLSQAMINNVAGSAGMPPILVGAALAVHGEDCQMRLHDEDPCDVYYAENEQDDYDESRYDD